MKRFFLFSILCVLTLTLTSSCKQKFTKSATSSKSLEIKEVEIDLKQFFSVVPDTYFEPKESKILLDQIGVCPQNTDIKPEKNQLSSYFLSNCSNCHGTTGSGQLEFPSLRKFTSAEQIINIVRNGKNSRMPSFNELHYPSDILAQDVKILLAKDEITSIDSRNVELAVINSYKTEEEFKEVMRKGLIAWRTPGKRGACMSCHGPDGIDLARFAYPNSAIYRRAIGQLLLPQQATEIVEMIAAHRIRNKITEPCVNKNFRPFQPGPKILTGDSSIIKENLLLEELKKIEIDLSQDTIKTIEVAKVLSNKIKELDVTSVPIAIELNHWTEDGFHGDEHKSTAEWIPELPFEPSSPENWVKWVEIQNNYLTSPNDENLWKMLDGVSLLSTERFAGSGIGERISREKYKSVLITQHMYRHNELKFPNLYQTKEYNRFSVWETAQIASSMLRGCPLAGTESQPFPCWNYTDSFFEKMGKDPEYILADIAKVNLPWLITGWLQDPSLQFTEIGHAQVLHLHQAFETFGLKFLGEKKQDLLPLHQVYISLVRTVKSVESMIEDLPYEEDLKIFPKNKCWHTPNMSLTQWVNQSLVEFKNKKLNKIETTDSKDYLTNLNKVINGSNKLILYKILESAMNKETLKCEPAKDDDIASITDVLDKINQWNEDSATKDSDIAGTITQIKDALK